MAGAAKKLPIPDRGAIVWIQHDPQAGKEMKGLHPMLVISPARFTENTGLVIGFPMTHAQYNQTNPFAIAIQGAKQEVGYILCHQPKSFDWEARGAGLHPWRSVPHNILDEALGRLDEICGICNAH